MVERYNNNKKEEPRQLKPQKQTKISMRMKKKNSTTKTLRLLLAALGLAFYTANLIHLTQRIVIPSVYVVVPYQESPMAATKDVARSPRKLRNIETGNNALVAQEQKQQQKQRQEQQQPDAALGGNQTKNTSNSTTQKPTVALCAIIKSEEAYLHEWMDYHTALGVTHFYLYDNEEFPELVLQPRDLAIDEHVQVNIQHWPGVAQQGAAYKDCAIQLKRALKEKPETSPYWVGFLDVDEFVVLHNHETLPEFLQQHCATGAVSLNWAMMGSSGQQAYRPLPVTQRFQDRVASVKGRQYDQLVKTFARIQDIKTKAGGLFNAHYVSLRNGYTRVDTDGNVQEMHSRRNTNSTITDHSQNAALVYHYRSKSAAEYQDKFAKGRSGTRGTNATWVAQQQRLAELGKDWMPGDIHDSIVWDTLKQRNPLYRVFDEPLREPNVPRREQSITSSTATKGRSSAICASLQRGDSAYIDEWVDYHRGLGFSSLILHDIPRRELEEWANNSLAIYDNNPTIIWRQPKKEWKGQPREVRLHEQHLSCVRKARKRGYRWLALLDVDQFLVLRNHTNVLDLLDSLSLEQAAGLGIYQYRFGTAEQRLYKPKPVTQRFQYREKEVDTSNWVRIINLQAPRSNMEKDDGFVDAFQDPMEVSRILPGRPTETVEQVAVVHHYATRSIKEHLLQETGTRVLTAQSIKVKTSVQRILRDRPLLAGSVHDDAAWDTMKKMNPRYSVFDNLLDPQKK